MHDGNVEYRWPGRNVCEILRDRETESLFKHEVPSITNELVSKKVMFSDNIKTFTIDNLKCYIK